MILSHVDIGNSISSGDIKIDPFDPERLNPTSYTLSLGSRLLVPRPRSIIDTSDPRLGCDEINIGDDGFVVYPGDFIIGSVAEKLSISKRLCARLDARTSLAGIGLNVLQNSTHIEAGQTDSNETLEITNVSPSPIKLWAGMKIVKVIFQQLQTPAEQGYSGPYLGQPGVGLNRISLRAQ